MKENEFSYGCFTATILCAVVLIGIVMFIETLSSRDRDSSDRYFLVPDPIAAKEGENQWLQLSKDKVNFKNSNKIKYVIDGVEYTTPLYIVCDPQ